MTARTRIPYRDPETSTTRWVIIFVLVSLLIHALIFLALILASIYVPPPSLPAAPKTDPVVNLTMVAPPPPPKPPPP